MERSEMNVGLNRWLELSAHILELLRLLPLVLTGFALEQIYVLGAKGYGPKRGRCMTLVEARRTYKRRALFRIEARLCFLKLLIFRAQFRYFLFRLKQSILFGRNAHADLSDQAGPELISECIHSDTPDLSSNAQAQPRAARSEAEGCTSAGAPGYAAVARDVPVSLNEANCAAGDHQQN